jgi:hypothetical protein
LIYPTIVVNCGQLLRLTCLVIWLPLYMAAQDLTPRAYVITPVRSSAVIFSYVYNAGEILLDPTVPIEDLNAQIHVPIVSFYHSFNFFSRSANVAVAVPYGYGHFRGIVLGDDTRITRSGLADSRIRLSVNLLGGQAMTLPQFVKHKERLIIGASVTLITPVGQYDPARLVNPGANRWAAKPEIGFARRMGRWAFDAYAGMWMFSTNSKFYPGASVREQKAMPSFEFHLGYYLRPRMWLSFDSNFWAKGNTVLNGVEKEDGARNSRVGGTFALPVTKHHSLKFSASRGAIARVGGKFTTVAAGWQYSWVHLPK